MDTLTSSYKKEFGTEYTLSPNYYNYYSARDAFSDAENPNGIRNLNQGGQSTEPFFQNMLNNVGTLETDFPTPQLQSQNLSIPLSTFQEKETNQYPIYVEAMQQITGIPYQYYTKEK